VYWSSWGVCWINPEFVRCSLFASWSDKGLISTPSYNPWTRRACTIYIYFVAVLKDPMYRLINYCSTVSFVFRKSCQHWRLPSKRKCYFNAVGRCRFIPDTLSRNLIFYITLLVTVCPFRLDDVILFIQKQSKEELWQLFTKCVSARTVWKIVD